MTDGLELRRDSLVRVLDVVRGLGRGTGIDPTLTSIARAVVDVLGFGAVVVNVRDTRAVRGNNGDLVVRTAFGPENVLDMIGQAAPYDTWIRILDKCEKWGELRFHEDLDAADDLEDATFVDPSHSWADQALASGIPAEEVWRPEYSLFAPMSIDGELLGVISVDLPRHGRIPDAEQRAILELFAGQAAAALAEAARLDSAEDGQELYRTVFLASPSATAVLDAERLITEANSVFADLVGRTDDSWRGMSVCDMFEGLREGVADESDHRVLRPDGTSRWARVRLQQVLGASGSRFVCTAEDTTTDREILSDMRRRAEHDDLTGLSVRSVAYADLADRLALPTPGAVGFLFFDIDDFKPINDRLGHPVGDRLLIELAGRLRGCASAEDLVCRIGGDEFAVVASRPHVDGLKQLARACIEAAATPYELLPANGHVESGLSVGVSVVTRSASATAPDVVTVEHMVRVADEALYRAKRDRFDRIELVVIEPVGDLGAEPATS